MHSSLAKPPGVATRFLVAIACLAEILLISIESHTFRQQILIGKRVLPVFALLSFAHIKLSLYKYFICVFVICTFNSYHITFVFDTIPVCANMKETRTH
jgi:hypothetical protein